MLTQSWGGMLLRAGHWHELLSLPLHLVSLPIETHSWVTPVLGAAGGMETEDVSMGSIDVAT